MLEKMQFAPPLRTRPYASDIRGRMEGVPVIDNIVKFQRHAGTVQRAWGRRLPKPSTYCMHVRLLLLASRVFLSIASPAVFAEYRQINVALGSDDRGSAP